MPRPPRTGKVKRRIVEAWLRDPMVGAAEIARRAGASQGYTSQTVMLAGRVPDLARKLRWQRIIAAWRRSPAVSYAELALLTGHARSTVARALRSIGIDRARRKGAQPPIKARRILAARRRDPEASHAEIARQVGATREWVHKVLLRRAA